VTLDHDVDTRRAERLLVSAVEQVTESASLSHTPEARIVELRPEGAVWELRFWVPDYTALSSVGQRIYEAVLHNLHHSGVRIPRSKEDVLVGPLADEREAEERAVGSWIDRIELFDALESEERADLEARARRMAFPKGTTVVERGAPGSSLFVLAEGALVVSVDAQGGGPPIAKMRPGDFFGEMSLLTGEPRSATIRATVDTVVYEITRSDLMPILERHPALPLELAAALEAHQHADTARAHVESDVQQDGDDRETRISRLRDGIRAWFKLPGE
jgi:CRP-like cAMP-binding protein